MSVDVAGFVNTYNDLRTQEPTLPTGFPIVLMNNLNARTAGVETTVAIQATSAVQVHAGYTHLYERFTLDPGSLDRTDGTAEHNDPQKPVPAPRLHEPARVVRGRRGVPSRRRSYRTRSFPPMPS